MEQSCSVLQGHGSLHDTVFLNQAWRYRPTTPSTPRSVYYPSSSTISSKAKYAREMLRQMHILDTSSAHPLLQEAYISNALVNPRGLPHTFYEIDLLLEHQNGEFKRFRADRGSSLQESDYLFLLLALTADSLQKIRRAMNKVIVGRQRKGQHPEKDASFDIQRLADHLHRSKSTHPHGPEKGKFYFSENQVPDLFAEGREALTDLVKSYNQAVASDALTGSIDPSAIEDENDELTGRDEDINELFNSAKEAGLMTSDLSAMYL